MKKGRKGKENEKRGKKEQINFKDFCSLKGQFYQECLLDRLTGIYNMN
jgi:hypothetical protein